MIRRSHQQDRTKTLSPEEGLVRIYKYCVYQERSHQEVRQKLFEFGLKTGEVDEILSRLIVEGFLNEERFAKTFTGGKFRIKKWGRVKIQRELSQKGLNENCIARGLKEIDHQDYLKTLKGLILRKADQSQEENLFRKRDKIARYVIGKGYESDLVWDVMKDLIPD